ncbi:hypothetical protein [Psychromicrobium xiongbiense]|uniref:hypothetical protein n=1 Tax=Psychromicrobium xiongbiense TaxID=3051184 RepID=UPI0025558A4F|nr:hypothetical protein [Psychromicrobium sp. YIM S02556]
MTEQAGYAGHTRISSQALTSLSQAAAAQALGVLPHEIRVEFTDDAGRLAIELIGPIAVPPLVEVVRRPEAVQRSGGSVFARAIAAKKSVLDRVAYLSGSDISRVDVRLSGVRTAEPVRIATDQPLADRGATNGGAE